MKIDLPNHSSQIEEVQVSSVPSPPDAPEHLVLLSPDGRGKYATQ